MCAQTVILIFVDPEADLLSLNRIFNNASLVCLTYRKMSLVRIGDGFDPRFAYIFIFHLYRQLSGEMKNPGTVRRGTCFRDFFIRWKPQPL